MASLLERNPIGRRTESDRTADGIRSDGERNPIGRRTESDWVANASGGYLTPFVPDRNAFATPSFRNISSRTGMW